MTETPDVQPAPVAMNPLDLVQPAPVQALTGMAAGPDGQQYVVDRYETPVGSFLFLLTPEQAIDHGQELIRRGKSAATGLVLPSNIRL